MEHLIEALKEAKDLVEELKGLIEDLKGVSPLKKRTGYRKAKDRNR